MTPTRASAPGKVILFGEHAVVYGQPALAVPVTQVQATASVEPTGEGIWIEARDLGRRYRLEEAALDDPLAVAINLTKENFPFHTERLLGYAPGFVVTVESTIPIASGLGSGAAVCTAIVRAVAAYLNVKPTNAKVASISFETEKLLHGTPSGIDNAVVAYGQPVYFVKGQPPEVFSVGQPFQLLIADTGLLSPTKAAVADVRAAYENSPDRLAQLFNAIGEIAQEARALLEAEQSLSVLQPLGVLMNRNHEVLREIGVSSSELDLLVQSAREAGALGAKLSGGGRGGNMIALVTPETEAAVHLALEEAGAKRVIGTSVGM